MVKSLGLSSASSADSGGCESGTLLDSDSTSTNDSPRATLEIVKERASAQQKLDFSGKPLSLACMLTKMSYPRKCSGPCVPQASMTTSTRHEHRELCSWLTGSHLRSSTSKKGAIMRSLLSRVSLHARGQVDTVTHTMVKWAGYGCHSSMAFCLLVSEFTVGINRPGLMALTKDCNSVNDECSPGCPRCPKLCHMRLRRMCSQYVATPFDSVCHVTVGHTVDPGAPIILNPGTAASTPKAIAHTTRVCPASSNFTYSPCFMPLSLFCSLLFSHLRFARDMRSGQSPLPLRGATPSSILRGRARLVLGQDWYPARLCVCVLSLSLSPSLPGMGVCQNPRAY